MQNVQSSRVLLKVSACFLLLASVARAQEKRAWNNYVSGYGKRDLGEEMGEYPEYAVDEYQEPLEELEKRAWNSAFAGGMGKRAWNSGFAGGMGKRAWNSGFAGGMGKRAWNSGFAGGMGKRAWNSGFAGKTEF